MHLYNNQQKLEEELEYQTNAREPHRVLFCDQLKPFPIKLEVAFLNDIADFPSVTFGNKCTNLHKLILNTFPELNFFFNIINLSGVKIEDEIEVLSEILSSITPNLKKYTLFAGFSHANHYSHDIGIISDKDIHINSSTRFHPMSPFIFKGETIGHYYDKRNPIIFYRE